VNQAAQIAKLVDEAVEFRDVVRDIPHAYRSTSCQAKALQGVCGMDQKMAKSEGWGRRTYPGSSALAAAHKAGRCRSSHLQRSRSR